MTTPIYKEWFDRLDRAMQRIIIAEEALALVKKGCLVPTSGEYWGLIGGGKCEVCALGGAFGSLMQLKGEGLPDEYQSSVEMRNLLSSYFEPYELAMIESAFERYVMPHEMKNGREPSGEEFKRAVKFGEQYATHSGRYEAIFCNIIHNEGTFTP